jgi:hypothetical protein
MTLVWHIVAWSIWISPNDVIFVGGSSTIESLMDRVKFFSYKWFLGLLVTIRADHRAGRVGFGPKSHGMKQTDEPRNITTSDRLRDWVWRVTGMADGGYGGWFISGENRENHLSTCWVLPLLALSRWVSSTMDRKERANSLWNKSMQEEELERWIVFF